MIEHVPAVPPPEAPAAQESDDLTEAETQQVLELAASIDALAHRAGIPSNMHADLQAMANAERASSHEVTQARVHAPAPASKPKPEYVPLPPRTRADDDDGGVFYLGGRAQPQIIPPKRPRFGP